MKAILRHIIQNCWSLEAPPPQILADQLTLSQPGAGADYARQIATSLPRFFRPSYGPVKFWGMIHTYVLDCALHIMYFDKRGVK